MCGGVSICIWCGCFGCAVVCTTLKNDVWHSYQSLSVDMNAPTDSRIRVHSLVQHPAVLGSSYLSPLSLRKLVTENSRHRKFTEQTTTLTSQSRRGLCLLLAFNRISIKRRLGFIFGNYRHVFHTSLFIFRVIFFYSRFFSSFPVIEKKNQHKETLYRDGNENMIL